MNIKKLTLNSRKFPGALRHIPSPPKQLYWQGSDPAKFMNLPRVAIVGNRKVSAYGELVTYKLAKDLAEQGVVIISGLALGVDAIAHRATLDAGGLAIAVLPSPVQHIVPVTNIGLARQILAQGGALVSEYAGGNPSFKQNFIARNRLMSGLADAVLITEAGEKSGSLHTSRFALEQGRTVMVVPGNITSSGSVGVHNLLKSGATPVTSVSDILHALGLEHHQTEARNVRGRNAHEQTVLDLLLHGINEGDQLLDKSGLTTVEYNQVLTMLEIGGKIRPLGGNNWAIY